MVFPSSICQVVLIRMTVIVHQSEFEEKEQKVLTGIKHLVHPDVLGPWNRILLLLQL